MEVRFLDVQKVLSVGPQIPDSTQDHANLVPIAKTAVHVLFAKVRREILLERENPRFVPPLRESLGEPVTTDASVGILAAAVADEDDFHWGRGLRNRFRSASLTSPISL